jgi:predicted short-subunit dehydrogenase-like oxidoreductase (DUF2520 family)
MLQNVISFIGAGKVAAAVCRELYHSGSKIDLVISPGPVKGKELAESCRAEWSQELSIPGTTGIVIVAVPDGKLSGVLQEMKISGRTLVAHTSGSQGIDIFPEHINKRGVFYPLQTFSENRKIDFSSLPFLIESSDNESTDMLRHLAESMGSKVYITDSERRRWLHLAAVFACNFTNHMLTAGKEIAGKGGFEMDILEPLIKETIAKALENGPENSQTGPAVRNDFVTIEKHLELLSFSPELKKIYDELTATIINYYKKNTE